MKRLYIFFIIAIFASQYSKAQLCEPILGCYKMKDTIVNTCTGTFKDSEAGGVLSGYSYANNENYTMTICSGNTNHLVLNFTQLDIKSGDFLRIYDGPNTSSPLLYTISNQNTTLTVVSSGTCLTFNFTSDNSGSLLSPNGNWTASISCTPIINTIDNPATVNGCNIVFLDDGINNNYSNNANYVKTFCPAAGSNCIKAEFSMVDIESGQDFLYVYDGNSTNSPLLATITGTSANSVTASYGNCMTFRFTSNATVNKKGWVVNLVCPQFCVPPCNSSPQAQPADFCHNAPPICDLNGYCGVTSSAYCPDYPGNLCSKGGSTSQAPCNISHPSNNNCTLFLGSIENNSWLKFVANDDTASFNVFVTTCSNSQGIQFAIYEATNCNNFVIKSDINLTSTTGIPVNNTSPVLATGLTPGNVYYIMIDGLAGDVCNYVIQADRGVQLGASISPPMTICPGDPATITVQTSGITPNWTANPPDPTLAGQTNQTTITVYPQVTTTYTTQLTNTTGFCTFDTTLSVTITVRPASMCQLTADAVGFPQTICDADPCHYSGPTILINEIMLCPATYDGCIYGTFSGGDCEGEWIELYNPDLCNPIDISCYYLGNNAEDPAGSPRGGGFVIPQGTIVPAGGFVVVRGRNATPVPSHLLVQNGGKTIEVVVDSRVCTGGGTRLWFPNAGGWFAFYDRNGVPQDAVSWGTSNTLGNSPCIPTGTGCTGVTSLPSYNSIPANKKNVIYPNSLNQSTDKGKSIRRIPDGAQWVQQLNPTPTMGNCNDVCNTPPPSNCNGMGIVTVTGGTGNFSYVWDNGENNDTAFALCTGVHYVTVTDLTLSLVAIDSVYISEPLPPATSFNITNTCPGTSNGSIDLTVNDTATFVYQWSNNASTQDISGLTAGTYIVTITGLYSSCQTVDTARVEFYPQPSVSIAPANTAICLYSSAQLTASGTNLAQYQWTGPNLSTNQGSTVSVNPVSTSTYTVTGTSADGCTATATATVNVNPLPVVTITTPDDSLCLGETTTLTASGAQSYTWAGSNITPSNTANPVTVNPTTSFVYSVTGTSAAGCQKDTAILIVVSPNPNIGVNISDTSLCIGEQANISGNGAQYYTWSAGLSASSGSNVTYTAASQGSYTFTVIGYNSTGCDDTTTFTINVYPNPNVSITPAYPEACSGQPLTVYAHGADFYQWSQGGTPSNLDSCTYYPTSSVVVTVTGTTTHGCKSTATVQLHIKPSPVISFTPYPLNGCQPLTVNFNYVSNPGDQCQWNFGDGSGANIPNPTHVYNNPGNYTVTLTVTTNEGCVGSHTENGLITVYPMPDANFIMQDSVVYMGTNVQMASTSANASTFNWNFGEPASGAANSAFTNNVEHLYNYPGVYYVTLIVTSNSDECIDSITKPIRVVDIQTTNVVTPNGDGKNDYFILPNVDLVENSHIIIYNRWGRIMYEDYNYKNNWYPADVADGVYFWILTMPNGKWFTGNVTVLKKDL